MDSAPAVRAALAILKKWKLDDNERMMHESDGLQIIVRAIKNTDYT